MRYISVFRRFSTRYFGICHFFLRYCGTGYPPMTPSFSQPVYSLLKQNIKSSNAKRRRQLELWKNLINKKAFHFSRAAHFFVHFFAVICATTTWKVQKVPSYTFYGRNVVRVLVPFFFHCRSFSPWWPLAFLIFSPPLQNFYVVLPTKKIFLCFLSLALALCRSFSRWALPAYHLLSLYLCLSLALYSKSVDMTINLSLIL